jgi:hypothetical protein
MKKIIILAMILMTTLAHAGMGSEGVGGGGGVVKDGIYMTFYSAGLYVVPSGSVSSSTEQIPTINDVFDYISNMDQIDLGTKTAFLNAIIPTNSRQYHVASPKELTPEIYKRLMVEFERATGVDPTNIRLFAITDVPQKTTYILPGFEKLSHNDQMAILFHEAYWIVYPKSSYNQIVNAEMAFQAALTNPSDSAAVYDFVTRIGASQLKVISALAKWDLSQGNLNGFVNKNAEFTLAQLYGQKFLQCFLPLVQINSSEATTPCDVYFKKNINDLIRQYPKSMIFRALAKHLDSAEDTVVGYMGETGSGYAPNDDGVVSVRKGLWDIRESTVRQIMACPVHLLETNKVDCKAGSYFRGGHLILNFKQRDFKIPQEE